MARDRIDTGHPDPLGHDNDAETVASYWKRRIPHFELVDSQRFSTAMNVASPCGEECRKAIDAAARLLRHVAAAYGAPDAGRHPLAREHYDGIARAAADTVLCYIYG